MALPLMGIPEVCAFASVPELQARFERGLACDSAILDVNLGPGQPTGLDAAEWLRSQGFAGRILFLTGHAASYPALVKVCQRPGNVLATKPTALSSLVSLLRGGPPC